MPQRQEINRGALRFSKITAFREFSGWGVGLRQGPAGSPGWGDELRWRVNQGSWSPQEGQGERGAQGELWRQQKASEYAVTTHGWREYPRLGRGPSEMIRSPHMAEESTRDWEGAYLRWLERTEPTLDFGNDSCSYQRDGMTCHSWGVG